MPPARKLPRPRGGCQAGGLQPPSASALLLVSPCTNAVANHALSAAGYSAAAAVRKAPSGPTPSNGACLTWC
eukprot:2702142-Lingulodinium_polyedra.AAC.1